jgi:hypothetical protein
MRNWRLFEGSWSVTITWSKHDETCLKLDDESQIDDSVNLGWGRSIKSWKWSKMRSQLSLICSYNVQPIAPIIQLDLASIVIKLMMYHIAESADVTSALLDSLYSTLCSPKSLSYDHGCLHRSIRLLHLALRYVILLVTLNQPVKIEVQEGRPEVSWDDRSIESLNYTPSQISFAVRICICIRIRTGLTLESLHHFNLMDSI